MGSKDEGGQAVTLDRQHVGLAGGWVIPSVTVVVPTRDRAHLVEDTVRALLALDYPSFDIVVVDQSANDATKDGVRAAANGDRRIRVESTDTVGAAAARTLGMRTSRADIVAYTDDDCIVAAGWLDAIVAEFNDPAVSAVCGRLLPYDYGKRALTGMEVGFKPTERRTEYARRVPPWYIGHGGNMAFRRADLAAIGGFDALLGAGACFGAGEDSDALYRLLAAGKHVVYSPRALAYHKHWKDWPQQRKMEHAYGIGVGAQFAKYVRCGDPYGLVLLATWIWQLGVRRVGAGLLKWRNPRVVYLGYCQLVYPWRGIAVSLRHPIDCRGRVYVER